MISGNLPEEKPTDTGCPNPMLYSVLYCPGTSALTSCPVPNRLESDYHYHYHYHYHYLDSEEELLKEFCCC